MIRTKIEKKVKEKRNDAINPIVLSSFLFATTKASFIYEQCPIGR